MLTPEVPYEVARQLFDDLSLVIWYGMAARNTLWVSKAARDGAQALLDEFKRINPDLWKEIQGGRKVGMEPETFIMVPVKK